MARQVWKKINKEIHFKQTTTTKDYTPAKEIQLLKISENTKQPTGHMRSRSK
jgi:hypothetical protein